MASQSHTVAWIGGDEFISICAKIAAPRDAGVISRKIIAIMSKSFDLQCRGCAINVNIGISVNPKDEDDGRTLIKKADTAMYRVKERGRCRYGFYSDVSNREW